MDRIRLVMGRGVADAVADKRALRRNVLARRDALEPAFRDAASRRIAERLASLPECPVGAVSAFWPIRSEVDTRFVLQRLDDAGVILALPALIGQDMVFRRWRPGDPLRNVGFGLSEPLAEAEETTPATLLVPLAAFDRRCHRLGYGGGFYDRAIAALRATRPVVTIGLAFAAQQVPAVPIEVHDQALDRIVTERDMFERKEA